MQFGVQFGATAKFENNVRPFRAPVTSPTPFLRPAQVLTLQDCNNYGGPAPANIVWGTLPTGQAAWPAKITVGQLALALC